MPFKGPIPDSERLSPMSSKEHLPAKLKKKAPSVNSLNAKQLLFIECYFANRKMNVEEAGRAAGYAPGVGQKVANHPAVKAEIQRRLQSIIWEHQADRERIVRELAAIAFANPQDLLDSTGRVKSLHELPQHVARTIRRMRVSQSEEYNEETGESVTVRNFDVEFHDKLTAVNFLMQHLGMFTPVEEAPKQTVDWDTMVRPHATLSGKELADAQDLVERRLLTESSPADFESP